jgi:hypothetical protein
MTALSSTSGEMRDLPANTANTADATNAASVTGVPAPSSSETPAATTLPTATDELVVVSHELLFDEVPSSRCDACGEPLVEADAPDGYGVPGRGVYLWARGEETRLESVPLCASCASAIGMTALARWEIEEEEG